MRKTISIYGRALIHALSTAFLLMAAWFFLDVVGAILFGLESTGHYLTAGIAAFAASLGLHADLITEREAAVEPHISCSFTIQPGGRITFERMTAFAEEVRQAVIDAGGTVEEWRAPEPAVNGENIENAARKAGA